MWGGPGRCQSATAPYEFVRVLDVSAVNAFGRLLTKPSRLPLGVTVAVSGQPAGCYCAPKAFNAKDAESAEDVGCAGANQQQPL